MTRRSLLAALGAALLTTPAGCTLFDDKPAQPQATASPPPPDPLLPLLGAETALLAQYDATLARYPQLARRFGAVRADHAAHLDAVSDIVRAPGPSSSTSATPTPSAKPIVSPTVAAAVAALRAAEVAGARRLAAACLAAPPAQAALLGSIAACESAHLVLVR